MSDDSKPAGSETELVDVKAKMSQMSGFRIRKEKHQRRVEAGAMEEPDDVEDSQDVEEVEEPPAEPSPPSQPASGGRVRPESAGPLAESAPMAPAPEHKASRRARADDSGTVGPATAFILGTLLGCVPAGVVFAMGLAAAPFPPGVPAEAVARLNDWIHCADSTTPNRWQCELYGDDGKVAGSGEFVPGVAVSKTGSLHDWRALAKRHELVDDGWTTQTSAASRTLFVRGVKVGVTSVKK